MNCSIIIPTFNTANLTLECLQDLHASSARSAYEIIVVDNASTDGTVQDITRQFPHVQIIANKQNLGFSKACNAGARVAKGRYLCFLNSDTRNVIAGIEMLREWLDKHPQTGIVGPELRSPDNQLIQMSWVWNPILTGELFQQYLAPYSLRHSAFRRKCVAWLQRKSRHVSIICGACLMIRRATFDRLAGFDEDFELYFEDSDLCYRCHQAGWEIDFVAQAKIVHHLGQSTRGWWSITSLIYQQSHLAYYRKHTSLIAVYMLKVYLFCKWLRLLKVSRNETHDREKAKAYCMAYANMLLEKEKFTLAGGIPA
jgi:GT2 family glycosyltransferase